MLADRSPRGQTRSTCSVNSCIKTQPHWLLSYRPRPLSLRNRRAAVAETARPAKPQTPSASLHKGSRRLAGPLRPVNFLRPGIWLGQGRPRHAPQPTYYLHGENDGRGSAPGKTTTTPLGTVSTLRTSHHACCSGRSVTPRSGGIWTEVSLRTPWSLYCSLTPFLSSLPSP